MRSQAISGVVRLLAISLSKLITLTKISFTHNRQQVSHKMKKINLYGFGISFNVFAIARHNDHIYTSCSCPLSDTDKKNSATMARASFKTTNPKDNKTQMIVNALEFRTFCSVRYHFFPAHHPLPGLKDP